MLHQWRVTTLDQVSGMPHFIATLLRRRSTRSREQQEKEEEEEEDEEGSVSNFV